jgi:hypothetical protein
MSKIFFGMMFAFTPAVAAGTIALSSLARQDGNLCDIFRCSYCSILQTRRFDIRVRVEHCPDKDASRIRPMFTKAFCVVLKV